NNFTEILNQSGMYSNNGEWHSQYQGISATQPSTVSEELVIKTESGEFPNSNCDEQNSTSGLTIPDEELIEMPVSRFNELLTTLDHEECNKTK
ncbi:hypothetical protein, partial [Salmonella sp. s54412]|uniref:hypothetical protein n=1 Tax=Salmonella sp. s54412 TaxID=3160128 RepID=UPI003753F1EC